MGNTVVQLRNDTAANWTTNNPTLALGEMGIETDTKKMKVGDGTTAWTSLGYYGTGASFKYGYLTLSADQTTRLSANNHIEFDTVDGSLDDLSTGTGQDNGIITLPAGKTYKITGSFFAGFSSTSLGNYIVLRVYDSTNSSYVGLNAYNRPEGAATSYSSQMTFTGIITPTSDVDIELRILANTNCNLISSASAWMLIEEYGGY